MRHIIEIITNGVLIALPINLLYLYIAGGWTEPNSIILNIEIFVLVCLPFFSIWRFSNYIREISHD